MKQSSNIKNLRERKSIHHGVCCASTICISSMLGFQQPANVVYFPSYLTVIDVEISLICRMYKG